LPTSTAAPIREREALQQQGFSLLETTVTLGIVALAATLVVPRLSGRGPTSLPVVAQDVVQRLTAARWQAVIEGRAVDVVLNDLPAGLQATEEMPFERPPAPLPAIAFAPLPAAVPRIILLTDAAGETARITIPAGLAALAVAYEAPS
jgi:prepilin-type N-terminal cleavage/methylation domain-containing protein